MEFSFFKIIPADILVTFFSMLVLNNEEIVAEGRPQPLPPLILISLFIP
jgi:hypothetical protein